MRPGGHCRRGSCSERRMSTVTVPASQPAALRVARRETLRQLLRSRTFVPGILIVAFWVFCAIFGYEIAPHDPLAQSPHQLVGLSRDFPFGTDQLGRDVLSRVLAGARSIITVALAATALGV